MSPPKALGARRASLAIALAVVAACGGATADLAPLEPDAAPGSDASVVDVALDTGGPESDASARDARDAEPEAAFDASSEDALPPLSGRARIRIANVSRYGQAYNYCYGPEGYPQIGPAPMWLQEGDVSQYFDVPAGARYVIQLRSPNASGCLPDGRPNPTLLTPLLTDGLTATLAIVGGVYDQNNSLTMLEDRTPDGVADGGVLVRVVNFAEGLPTVDVRLGSGAATTPFLAQLPEGRLAVAANVLTGDPVDALGYVATHPWDVPLSAKTPNGEPWSGNLTSKLMTVYLFGTDGRETAPARFLTCLDDAPTPYCASWRPGTPESAVQIVHLAPDAPPVDMCVRVHGASYGSPVLATAGLGVPAYLSHSAGVPALPVRGSYDVKVIPAGEVCASRALAEEYFVGGGTNSVPLILYERQFGSAPSYGLLVGNFWAAPGSGLTATAIHAADIGPNIYFSAKSADGGAPGVPAGPLAPGALAPTGLWLGTISTEQVTFSILDTYFGSIYTAAPRAMAPAYGLAVYIRVSETGHGLVFCSETPSAPAAGACSLL